MGCPACRDLKELLTRNYGEEAVVYNDVSIRENGEKLVALYSMIYPEMQDLGIPLTIIVIDGEPAGSVIGAMPDDFWTDMINECLKTGKFMIFDGQALYVAEKDPLIMKQISEIIGLSHPTATAPITSTNSSPTTASSTASFNTTQTLPPTSTTPTALAKNSTQLEWTWAETPVKEGSAQLTNYAFMIAAAALLLAILALQFRRKRQ